MRTTHLLLLTHSAVAGIVAATAVSTAVMPDHMRWSVVAGTFLVCVVVAAWVASKRVRKGLALLSSIASGESVSAKNRSGLQDYDQIAYLWMEAVTTKEEIEGNYHRYCREIESILRRLEHSTLGGQISSVALRSALGSIGVNMHRQMGQVLQSVDKLPRTLAESVTTTNTLEHAMGKVDASIEQLASSNDEIKSVVSANQQRFDLTAESIESARQGTAELTRNLTRIQSSTDRNIRMIRSLCDPSRQISAMIETISDVAAQTNMLALNASIESIRAGEHGRGFAIVADEIRQLAEKTSQATREMASVTESLLAQTKDTAATIAGDSRLVANDVKLIDSIDQKLAEMMEATAVSKQHLRKVTDSERLRQRCAEEAASTIAQLGETIEAERTRLDQVHWTVKSISKTANDLGDSVLKLARCSDNHIERSHFGRQAVTRSRTDRPQRDGVVLQVGTMGEASSVSSNTVSS